MKFIPIEKYRIIDSGQTWPHANKPCQKDMLPFLEKNEALVTWLQPRCAPTSITKQIPSIRVKNRYYTVSLRMMKAIWRHVRLIKGFVNKDVAKDGQERLRIPMALFHEKLRTQLRFNVGLF
jgi:hypothetical protein